MLLYEVTSKGSADMVINKNISLGQVENEDMFWKKDRKRD